MANKRARVLVEQTINGKRCQCGQIVEGDAKVLKPYIDEKVIDVSKAAVDYALDAGATIINVTTEEVVTTEEDVDQDDLGEQ